MPVKLHSSCCLDPASVGGVESRVGSLHAKDQATILAKNGK